jgi:hypothetical protein
VEKYVTAGQDINGTTIRRMPFACWVHKTTDTHSEYVILLSTATVVMRTRLNVMLHVRCPYCYSKIQFMLSYPVLLTFCLNILAKIQVLLSVVE